MKRIILLLLATTLLAACGNKTEKEFADLVAQADTHYSRGDYEAARIVYEKALDLKENVDVRNKYDKAKAEIKLSESYGDIKAKITTAVAKLDKVTDITELKRVTGEVTDAISELEALQVDSTLRSSVEVRSAKKSKQLSEIKYQAASIEARGILGTNYYELATSLKKAADELINDM